MAGTLVETLYGKRHKYEIHQVSAVISARFAIYRDGHRWKGDYATLARAIEMVRESE